VALKLSPTKEANAILPSPPLLCVLGEPEREAANGLQPLRGGGGAAERAGGGGCASLKKKADSLCSGTESHRIVLHHHLIDSVARDPREGSTGGQLREGGRSSGSQRRAPRPPSPAAELPGAAVSMADGAGMKQRESTF
jgi:hypothetical protein